MTAPALPPLQHLCAATTNIDGKRYRCVFFVDHEKEGKPKHRVAYGSNAADKEPWFEWPVTKNDGSR